MTSSRIAERRARGFTRPKNAEIDAEMRRLDATNIVISIAYALTYVVQLWVLPLVIWWMGSREWWWLVWPGAFALFIWQGSRLRALENLVHDAAHLNWSRGHKWLNDLTATLIVASPVMQVLTLYRAMHGMHHAGFGSSLDPCMARAVMAGRITRGNPLWVRLWAAIKIVPELSADYYRSQFDRRSYGPVAFIVWHVIVVIVPYTVFVGFADAIGLWLTFWLLPFLIALPIIRALAESEEHDYGHDGGELQATFTNDKLMWRILIHPAGDAWHAAHHVRMTVPAWKVKQLHELLVRSMPEYRATLD
ncbi:MULTISPECIES: fatty acid desaturase [unclassified Devosia]|uniref:fatty acid desaturase n=1 Tax=unclassified Devosia TaxID=196773 RepID=UPI000869DA00|nr:MULTISPECIES: fatty acid desaturase [unclassified Devosia]MBN9361772.1 fatty acid desaturase [Devosia sp.]ODS87611.1 MAG: hypothetical protein ABS47_11780 [Devosia sp. SCN 66-27]OJX26798.1 MAG: hypothetical protein BGO83_23435 [Devosia sp. 66-14]